MGLFQKIFGTYSDRELKKIMPIVAQINSLEDTIQKLSDEELKAKTPEFKERLANGETLDDLLPEAFAVVREASRRVLGMRHFDVQLIGGIVLHQGRIAEMKTGEGKTLVATLPVYLNALTGKGVHVVTVNDYLAKRDSDWMGKIYKFLGLSIGTIVHGLTNEERRAAYACDITYGTNHEFGFDYLRDNMVIYKEHRVQRELNYAIVDEVDSILIDEARTPLIISGSGHKSTELYEIADRFVRQLKPLRILKTDDRETYEEVKEDYIIDEKAHSVSLTAIGVKKAEQFFRINNLSDPENITILHHINQALKAHGLMKRDRDYVVKDGEVIIVDEFTGRLMYGRRYSDGLHQAIEAKENVQIARETMTQATITYQNYFRLYKKLSGMTGTAQTEEAEFNGIYKLDVIVIPTNKPMIRVDLPDVVYKTEKGKFNAVIEEVCRAHEKGQPVLIGTISIEKSEILSEMLKKRGIKHSVLNAKHHEKEAEIIAQAGKLGAVTIATNMAGRGTDIVLGGNAEYMAKQEMRKKGYSDEMINASTGFDETNNPEILEARKVYRKLVDELKENLEEERKKVVEAGGLYIIGTERHESRRIDNQLRGRAGRQGDPGKSRFFISLEDDLMRLFLPERFTALVDALGLDENQPIEHKMLSNAIETAQKRVESNNYQIRKNVLQYDDVVNQQREIIYRQRMQVLNGEDLSEYYIKMIQSKSQDVVELCCGETSDTNNWNWDLLVNELTGFVTKEQMDQILYEKNKYTREVLQEDIEKSILERYRAKEKEIGPELMRELERVVLLRVVDEKWMDHIDALDQLRYGIGLRGYGQRDPVIEYKFEAFEMFEEMIRSIKSETLRIVLNAAINDRSVMERKQVAKPQNEIVGENQRRGKKGDTVVKGHKIGRNEPCPCGSGKKYKYCCGA